MFASGSYLMVRSFSTPPVPPCCPACACLPNDDVHSLWWFTVGTFTTVPVTAIYVYFYQTSTTFAGALFICCFASVASVVITALFYPSRTNPGPLRQILSPILHPCCCGPGTRCYPHARNDWLILCWLGFWATALGIIAGCVVFIYYAYYQDAFQMYQYGLGVADMVLLLVGDIYYLAGSYSTEEEPVSDMMPSSYSDQQIQRFPPSTPMTYVQPLPVGWEKGDDPESGSPFYFNRGLGISQVVFSFVVHIHSTRRLTPTDASSNIPPHSQTHPLIPPFAPLLSHLLIPPLTHPLIHPLYALHPSSISVGSSGRPSSTFHLVVEHTFGQYVQSCCHGLIEPSR